MRERQSGLIIRVSVSSTGAQGNGGSNSLSISSDGRYVAFYSGASDLVTDDSNSTWDIFVHDRQTGQTTQLSYLLNGSTGE